MMEAESPSETQAPTTATWRNIPEDGAANSMGILYSHNYYYHHYYFNLN
jgi:hypothetical protein